jgi:hypothetical protein
MTEAYLSEKHRQDLLNSGIDPEWALKTEVCETIQKKTYDWTASFNFTEGLAFFYYNQLNDAVLVRIKPDDIGQRKYLSPVGSKNKLYFPIVDKEIPYNIWAVIKDPKIPLYLTEGEKKCLKANLMGIPCVGLPGVWGWRTRVEGQDPYKVPRGISTPIEDLDLIDWNRRKVFVCFDSDAQENHSIQLSVYELKKELIGRGAEVRQIDLPGAESEKVGLDDYLLNHTREEFLKLPQRAIRKPVAVTPTRPFRQNPEIPALEWSVGGVYGDEIQTIYNRLSAILSPTDNWVLYGENLMRVDLENRKVTQMTRQNLPGQLVGHVEIIYFKENQSGVTVPKGHGLFPSEHSQAYLHSSEAIERYPKTNLISLSPVFTEDWQLINRPGLHRDKLVYYLGEEIQPETSRDLVEEMLSEVAWRDPQADKANFLAMLLTGITIHHWGKNQKPMAVINADKSRAGKSTLAEILCAVIDGVEMSSVSFSNSEEEFEKALVSRYIGASACNVIAIDNVRNDEDPNNLIKSRVLEMDITAPIINHRILGGNKEINRPNNFIYVMTVNEARLGGDLPPRSLPINLYLGNVNPAERIFKNKELIRWVLENRPAIVAELLGMVTRWLRRVRRGMVRPADLATHPIGAVWAETMDWILRVNEYTGFLSNFEESQAEYDPSSAVMEEVLLLGKKWEEVKFTSGELFQACKDSLMPLFYGPPLGPVPKDLGYGETDTWKARKLGYWLKARVGRMYWAGNKQYKLCSVPKKRGDTNPTQYWFEVVKDLSK